MKPIFMTLIVLLSVLTFVALYYVFVLRSAIERHRRELAELKKITGVEKTVAEGRAPWMRMVVEIKDPIALAHRESAIAKIASPTAPNLVVKKVYEQVMEETRERLAKRNVDASVKLIVL